MVDLFHANEDTDQCILETHCPNLKIISGSIKLPEIELNVENSILTRLKTALESLKFQFDFIIIDCSPSLGYLTLNSFVAADSIIIPVQCEFFAFNGLQKLLATIKSIKTNFNSTLDIEGVLVNMYDKRLSHSNHIINELKKHFQDLIFKKNIKRNISLSEAPSFGTSILDCNVTSEGSTDYLKLSQEIMKKQALKQHNPLGKKIPQILQDTNEEISFLDPQKERNLEYYKPFKLDNKNFKKLIGCTKKEVIVLLGLVYNDIQSNIWMYRISEKTSMFRKNFLYIYFEKNTVKHIQLKRFKFR